MGSAARIVVQIDVDDKGNPAIKALGNNMQTASQQAAGLSLNLKSIAKSILVFKAFSGLQAAIGFTTKEIFSFNKILKQTEGITGAAPESIERLKDLILDLGNASEFTATEIAGAGLQLSKMGISVAHQMKQLPAVLDLATASVVSLESAVEVAAQTTKGFGLDMRDLDQVANIIQTTISSTAIGLEDFKESMKFIAPIARTAGISLEDVASSIGILGDVGIKGSLAGTSLKNIMTNLLKPSVKVAAALRKMNLEGKALPVILKGLRDRGLGVTDFLEGFNLRALAGSLALRDMSKESEILRKKLVAQTVTVKAVSEVIRTSWIDQLLRVRNVMVNVGIELSRVFEDVTEGGVLKDFTQFWIDLSMTIRENRQEIREFVQKGVNILVKSFRFIADHTDEILFVFKFMIAQKVAQGIGKLVTGIGGIATSLGSITSAAPGAQAGLAGVATKVGSITLALTAGMIAIDFFVDKWEKGITKMQKFGSDFSKSGFRNRAIALKQLRTHLVALEKLKDAAEKAKSSTETRPAFFSALGVPDINVGLEKANLAVGDAKHALESLIADISASTGVSEAFLKMNSTVLELDQTIRGLKIHIVKVIDEEDAARAKIKAVKGVGLKPGPPKPDKATKAKKFSNEAAKAWFGHIVSEFRGTQLSDVATRFLTKQVETQFESLKIEIPSGGFSGFDSAIVKVNTHLDSFARGLVQNASKNFPNLNRMIEQFVGNLGDLRTTIGQTASVGTITGGLGAQAEGANPVQEIVSQNKAIIEEGKQDIQGLVDVMNSGKKAISDARRTISEDLVKNSIALGGFIAQGVTSTLGAINSLLSSSTDEFIKNNDLKVAALERARDIDIKSAGKNARKKIRIEQKFEADKKKIDEANLARQKENAKQQQGIAIAQALINGALAITNALATVKPFTLAVAAAAAAGIATAAQIVTIKSQSFRNGGIVKGFGGSTSDSVRGNLSVGELVLPAQRVASLGGQRGVEQALADDVDFVNRGGNKGTVVLNIGTFIGADEQRRQFFLELEKESARWLSI